MIILVSPLHAGHAPRHEMDGELGAFRPSPEVPQRVEAILQALRGRGLGEPQSPPPGPPPLEALHEAHDPGLVHFLSTIWPVWRERVGVGAGHGGNAVSGEVAVIPDVFALRRLARRPADPLRQAGWYCFDPQTPLLEGTWEAALGAAGCALEGARRLSAGERLAYALCRPPGHHAGRDYYGGYCFLNNAALAACRLKRLGRTAVLDLDYHHGNGTQDIFYGTGEVLYVSLHADPDGAYPCFSGYRDETGEGDGRGANRNFPLPRDTDEAGYLAAFEAALEAVGRFRPESLVVSLGVDTVRGDPIGGMGLAPESFRRLGRLAGSLGRPTLVVQEGGYSLELAGPCVAFFLEGLQEALQPA